MNVLFVCSRNKWRSATAERLYRDHPHHTVRSAGTSPAAHTRISATLLSWADIVFVMEKKHREIIRNTFDPESLDKQIIVLDIPDDYSYMDPELIDMIRTTVDPLLEKKNNQNG